jgi:hypothetical protein
MTMTLRNLRRLDEETIAIEDADVVIVCASDANMANLALIGCGVRAGTAGWRCLQHATVDIGHRPTRELAVECLLEYWKRHRRTTPIWRGHHSPSSGTGFPPLLPSKLISWPETNQW